ncbi:Ppx/GppA phosphatase family protein [Chlorobium phaeobacteroides]|jgi:exopolyphosphatase/guanosine-5'-triphosphate,3'-diphosphate pyrophosphatase|uniref:Ppx/GppA phosphatase n=1 Tax=Chlorobium phaeobacteroides (strain DSM 266 / SMG 266 / 2430) TaxID=290317 RepID=A1BJJ7_CHLPD|nr:Ppx/GppA phosphatase family protein [Chlorobium phaeobacteroides]ABL66574.1 Ppx/GppA phosphatase [Chlorobium phaeobacteroides DSM 266]MBV5319707.1 Ppx/GppA family phosphatase [Chlorobium phaeobacteroides]
MKRISCIDIGTNTALLLIADLDPKTGQIIPVCHKQTIIRLGKNVDEERQIGSEALHRLVSCMHDYGRISAEYSSATTIAVGTSALRDAKNRDAIIEAVAEATNIKISCISGHEEAELTFFGAIAGTNEIPDLFSVIDIGGGSTEISMGTPEKLTQSISLDIGSVRLTERHFTTLPPSPDELLAAKETINATLAAPTIPFLAARENVFGVAGTLTTIAQLSQGLRHFDAEKVHHYPLSYAEVRKLLEKLKTSTLQEIVNMGIPEGRADVITMGTLILLQIMRLLGIGEIRVSIQGLRFGLAQKELHRLQKNI